MKKFNEFECSLIVQGLQLVAEGWKAEIAQVEAEGKRSMFTQGYVDMVVKELTEKVQLGTLKPKK
jgi:hypothetical protein